MVDYPHADPTDQIIGAAIEVHRHLGPGLLESVYETCLCHVLELRGIPYKRQVELPVHYKDAVLDAGFRLDVLVGDQVVLELKSVAALEPIHDAQLLTYLKLSKHRIGLLINFNTPLLKDGIKRRIV